MRRFSGLAYLSLGLVGLTYAFFMALTGCASRLPASANLPASKVASAASHVMKTPAEFKAVATTMDVFIVFGVAIVSAGFFVFFAAPEAHRLSSGLLGGGGALVATALVVHLSLWALPLLFWGTIGIVAAAAVVLVIEFYLKIKAQNPPTVSAAIADIPEAAASIGASIAKMWQPVSPK